MRRVIALGMSIVMSGCSFALVSGPPPNHQQLPAFECTTSKVGPVLDTIWTALHVVSLGFALSKSEQEWDDSFEDGAPYSRNTSIGLDVVFAALGAAGMWFGYTRTAACSDAKSQLIIRQTQQPVPGPGGAEPWPPLQPAPPTNAPAPEPAPGPPPPPAP